MEKVSNNPSQNNLHPNKNKIQAKKIPHDPKKFTRNNKNKNLEIRKALTKTKAFSTYNVNLKKNSNNPIIKRVNSYSKMTNINSRNKYATENGAINNRITKKKLSFTKRTKKDSSNSLTNNTENNINKSADIINNNIITPEKSRNVKVFIRFRPSNEIESSLLQNNYGWLVPRYISNTQVEVYSEKPSNQPNNLIYSFDQIFTPKSSQKDIYSTIGSHLVEDIMAGYNGTIFAYGQSGSGKTYTMYGEDIFDENKKGIIPRIISEIFKKMEKIDDVDFTIKLSVMEIYKEILYDLFTGRNNLKIIENKDKIYVENLSQVYLSDLDEFFNYTELSQRNRKVAETKLNHNSSRSHCIMILEVIQNFKKEKIIKKGILNLVDLAGSEKVSKTGAVGETLEEAKKINLSLSTLGNVIHSLTSKDSTGHVPFRDSKLTRILKESLGGNYKTYLIVTCSPHSYNMDEIISSLNFAKRVKCIKNNYKINIKYSYDELQDLVDKLKIKLNNANNQINKLLKGEKIEANVLSDYNTYDPEFYVKEKKNLENKIQELMETNEEKDNEIIKLKKEIEYLKNNQKSKNINDKNINNKKNYEIKNQEIVYSINNEKTKEDEINDLYKKIKETLNKIEEENERIKIIQNEEEEIRKINLKKEQFNSIIQDFLQNKDKIKCFEKIDNITKLSIPCIKEKNYKNLLDEFKNNIQDIFINQFSKKNQNNTNNNYKNLFDVMTINLFLKYLHFYFSNQILNQGYLKLLLDNKSLNKMNNYLFSIIHDILIENYDIANENAINANAISYLRASIADSFVSKQGINVNNTFSELNKKMVKVVNKGNMNSLRKNRNSIKLEDLRNSNFSRDNNKMRKSIIKSQECEKNNGKINMIRNVLVNIIKETDYIKKDIKEMEENINITIKSIMNYFCQKILKNKNVELDINNNLIIEKSGNNMNTINSTNDLKNDENKNPNCNYDKPKKIKSKSKKKFENIVPTPQRIKQAKGDEYDNDNNCFDFS